ALPASLGEDGSAARSRHAEELAVARPAVSYLFARPGYLHATRKTPLREPIAIEAEHEQADRRRQVGKLAVAVDRGDNLRQGRVAARRDLLQAAPEWLLEADAGLVPGNDNGAFDHQGFHRPSPDRIGRQSVAEPSRAPRRQDVTAITERANPAFRDDMATMQK